MGWENVFHCEWNEFGQRILKYYWPDAKSYGDITKTYFTEWNGKVDIVSGGFPCQPYSVAGKRKGKADDRHLWPEMLRAIREIQPRWVVGENVPGLLNWEGGMVLDEIKADLEAAGFEVFPPLVLPACGKNAPHRRDRLWILANSHVARQRRNERQKETKGDAITYPSSQGLQVATWREQRKVSSQARALSGSELSGTLTTKSEWKGFPTVSPIRGRDDGLSSKLVKQCLEGLGNSVVPQVVFELFKAIEEIEN